MRLARMQHVCKTHPTYALRRQPRSSCADCWAAWRRKESVFRALRQAITAVERLYYPDEVQASIRWSGGRGDTKAFRMDSVGVSPQAPHKE